MIAKKIKIKCNNMSHSNYKFILRLFELDKNCNFEFVCF